MLTTIVLAMGMAAAPPADATKLTLTSRNTVVEIDAGRLKGDIVRLAWSDKGDECYLQTAEQDGRGNVTLRHYVLALNGQQPKARGEMPEWAQAYWQWKSAQSAPGMPGLRITVEQRQKRLSATAAPAGGDLAKGGLDSGGGGRGGGTGAGPGDAVSAAQQSQMVSVVTLRLKGETLGEFVNAPALPGTTFGWGPAATGLIAFVGADGRLVIMDSEKRKIDVPGASSVSQPAWSADGKRLAWLERIGRTRFLLRTVDVTIPAP
jgi:hypothetical protein